MRCNGYVVLSFFALFAVSSQAGTAKLQSSPDATRAYPLATREAQFRAVSAMPQVDVEYGAVGRIRRIEGHSGIFLPSVARLKQGDKATELLQRVKGLLMASGSESLIVNASGRTPDGGGYFAFTQQMIQDIPVLDAPVNVVAGDDGEVRTIAALFVPQGAAKLLPDLSAKAAKAKLEEQLADTTGTLKILTEGSLAFWTNSGQEEIPRLVWILDAQYSKDDEPQLVRFGVDAATGEIRSSQQLSFGLNRSVYTNGYRSDSTTPPASALLWTEGNPGSSDPLALSLYDRVVHPIQTWSGHTFAYDTVGLVAHYITSSTSFQIFGTPDNKSYLFFGDGRATDDDAIAHEYGHGMFPYVLNQPSAYVPFDDWYAGNEFYGDLSAVVTDIRRFGMTDASWQITNLRNWYNPQGANAFHNDWYPHRFFANPFQPRYSNSTIFGHAVYLMIHGGMHRRQGSSALSGPIPSTNVIGRPWQQIQQVLSYGLWLVRLYNERWSAYTYKARTIQAATTLYGAVSGIPLTVEQAWTAVGIGHN